MKENLSHSFYTNNPRFYRRGINLKRSFSWYLLLVLFFHLAVSLGNNKSGQGLLILSEARPVHFPIVFHVHNEESRTDSDSNSLDAPTSSASFSGSSTSLRKTDQGKAHGSMPHEEDLNGWKMVSASVGVPNSIPEFEDILADKLDDELNAMASLMSHLFDQHSFFQHHQSFLPHSQEKQDVHRVDDIQANNRQQKQKLQVQPQLLQQQQQQQPQPPPQPPPPPPPPPQQQQQQQQQYQQSISKEPRFVIQERQKEKGTQEPDLSQSSQEIKTTDVTEKNKINDTTDAAVHQLDEDGLHFLVQKDVLIIHIDPFQGSSVLDPSYHGKENSTASAFKTINQHLETSLTRSHLAIETFHETSLMKSSMKSIHPLPVLVDPDTATFEALSNGMAKITVKIVGSIESDHNTLEDIMNEWRWDAPSPDRGQKKKQILLPEVGRIGNSPVDDDLFQSCLKVHLDDILLARKCYCERKSSLEEQAFCYQNFLEWVANQVNIRYGYFQAVQIKDGMARCMEHADRTSTIGCFENLSSRVIGALAQTRDYDRQTPFIRSHSKPMRPHLAFFHDLDAKKGAMSQGGSSFSPREWITLRPRLQNPSISSSVFEEGGESETSISREITIAVVCLFVGISLVVAVAFGMDAFGGYLIDMLATGFLRRNPGN